uniref:Uncharacterized protein n=1 Tax=Moniliophthora roreri TaxID=221103 RepID=A0A0W0FI93_MONRR
MVGSLVHQDSIWIGLVAHAGALRPPRYPSRVVVGNRSA